MRKVPAGDVVEISSDELRSMDLVELLKFMKGLGIDTASYEQLMFEDRDTARSTALTRLMQSAVGIRIPE